MGMRRKKGFALPVVLVSVLVVGLMAIGLMSRFLDQGSRLRQTKALRQAQLAAMGGFELALGKLLAKPLSDRWYAKEASNGAHFEYSMPNGFVDVYVCDVYNDNEELAHIHVFARGQSRISVGQVAYTVIYGSVRPTAGTNGDQSVAILERKALLPRQVAAFVKANEELFSADGNPFVGRVESMSYGANLESLVNQLNGRNLALVDFSDDGKMKCLVALLEQYLALLRNLQLARAANDLLRNAAIGDVFRLGSEFNAPVPEVWINLRAMLKRGEKLTSERAAKLLKELTRSQRELLTVYRLIKLISELPQGSKITLGSVELKPGKVSLKLAKLLFESISKEETALDSVEAIFDELMRLGKKLNGTNVFNHFFRQIDELAVWKFAEGARVVESALPLRDLLINHARPYALNSTRLPFDSTAMAIYQDDSHDYSNGPPVNQRSFEQAISSMEVYGQAHDANTSIDKTINSYVSVLHAANGEGAYQEVGAQAGLLGIDGTRLDDFANMLQNHATSNGVWWVSVYFPSADLTAETANTDQSIETLNEFVHGGIPEAIDSQITGVPGLTAIGLGSGGPGSGYSGTSGSSQTSATTTEPIEQDYTADNSDQGGEMWIAIGTSLPDPYVGSTPPQPPPPPPPPPAPPAASPPATPPAGSPPPPAGSPPGSGSPPAAAPPPPPSRPPVTGSGPVFCSPCRLRMPAGTFRCVRCGGMVMQ